MPLRILHVVESMSPEAGSVTVCLRGLVDSLSATEANSRIAAPGDAGIDDAIRSVDLVHIHGWGHQFARAAARAAQKSARPYVISPHGVLFRSALRAPSWPSRVTAAIRPDRLLAGAAALAGVNESETSDLLSRQVHPNVVPLPYGLPWEEYQSDEPGDVSLPPAPKGRLLLMLGPIDPVEGLVALLKAVAEIGSLAAGWGVVLAGRTVGDWKDQIEPAIRRKGGADRVLLTTAADITTQRAWLARCSVLVAPGLHIGCGVSVMQAVASGVPVLASSLVVPPRLGDCVHVCKPARGEIKIALRRLIELPDDERRTLARTARQEARTVIDWSCRAADYLQLYHAIVKEPVA